MRLLNEWFVQVPWGKIALVSWGDPKGEPVLLLHGRQDSLDTFLPLLELLPATYHYVGVDIPGHGRSDPLPISVMITRTFPVSIIDAVVKHMKWDHFIFIGHSMGAEEGLFYNAVNPGRITKFILLDVRPALQRLQITDHSLYFKTFYDEYYSNYNKYNIDNRVYTTEQAVQAVMKARGMTREQAEVILARNMKKVADDKYQLSWDMRLKILAPLNLTPEYYSALFSMHCPPSLYLNATQAGGKAYAAGREAVDEIFEHLSENVKNIFIIDVEGGHDVHFTNPERLINEISAFLNKDFGATLSKL